VILSSDWCSRETKVYDEEDPRPTEVPSKKLADRSEAARQNSLGMLRDNAVMDFREGRIVT